MADDKTTKMPEQPVTDTGPGKETPPEPEKTPTPPEAEKKTEQQAKSPQVSVYDFAEIMKEKAGSHHRQPAKFSFLHGLSPPFRVPPASGHCGPKRQGYFWGRSERPSARRGSV